MRLLPLLLPDPSYQIYQTSGMETFDIKYNFIDESQSTELSMYINGKNILAFTRNGKHMTTRWNLDELAEWLRSFIDTLSDDPYPVDVKGRYAAEKDIAAREFDSDDEDVFDEYYEKLNAWTWNHTWHHASSGAILADLYFQKVGDSIEISWNNQNCDESVSFDYVLGGATISKEDFINAVNRFLRAYALHWFSEK